MTPRVVLCDPHVILRDGVRTLLHHKERARIVAESPDVGDALRLVLGTTPHVLITELALDAADPVRFVRQVRARAPEVRVLVLSQSGEPRVAAAALHAGAHGYLVKHCSFDDLVGALDTVMRLGRYLPPGLSQRVLEQLVGPTAAHSDGLQDVDRLSPRERQVLRLIAEGLTSGQIAARLNVSPHTVQSHRKNLMEKLGVHHSVGLTRLALRRGLTGS